MSTDTRTVYTSPCGRMQIVRTAPEAFVLFCEGNERKTYADQTVAELYGLLWLDSHPTPVEALEDVLNAKIGPDFVKGMGLMYEAAQLLGNRKARIGMLRLLAAIEAEDITEEEFDAILYNRPSPKPQPPAPRFPEPDDFIHERPLGELLGEPVVAHQLWDEETGRARLYALAVELNGLNVIAYPEEEGEAAFLNIRLGEGLASHGDLWWEEWGKLRELATDPRDPMGKLMTMARKSAPASQRKAA